MKTGRLEAFSDGVLAIIITVMVLELKPPEGPTLADFSHITNGLLTYLLSFIYIGIYWNNHHHLFQIAEKVDGLVLWANLSVLFWLSLLPFTTAWMEDTHFAQTPVVVYGVDLLLAGISFFLLQRTLLRIQPGGRLARAMAADIKGKLSPIFYIAGIGAAFINVWAGMALYVLVALIWLVPDKRMEKAVREAEAADVKISDQLW